MHITRLQLTDYRNYERLDLTLEQGVSLFIGANAQGKTNLLEAVYLLCTGRSHRGNRDRELIRHDCDYSRVFAEAVHSDGKHTAELYLSRSERKRVRVNGLPVSRLGQLIGTVYAVMFSPEDLRLVKEGPVQRRAFLDGLISQVKRSYLHSLTVYLKALEQRNNLLREMGRSAKLSDTLPVWDEQLARAAVPVISARREYAERIHIAAGELNADISGGERIDIEYRTNIDGMTEDDIIAGMFSALEAHRKEDAQRGNTSVGPHRDDLHITLNGTDLRSFGSQGQHRTAALALKLSEIEIIHQETGERPVLLLDDVMSELDSRRRTALLERIKDTQTLVTGTAAESGFNDAVVYEVEQGRVRRV